MTTLVIGANGKIGRQLCDLARARDEPVRAMIRDAHQRNWFAERGIETVVADLEDDDFSHAFADVEQVLFTAGSGPHTGADKTLLIDLFAAMRATDYAGTCGAKRFLMVSAMRARDPQSAPEKLRPYMAAKFAADAYLRNAAVPHVIVQPGRLTDEQPATGRIATSLEEAGAIDVSRANVAHVLLYVMQDHTLRNREFVVLDGGRDIAEALCAG